MQTLAAGAAEVKQIVGRLMMTSARSHRTCSQACLHGGQQNLYPAMVPAQGGVSHAVMGQGILEYSLHSSKASIWHSLEQLCPGEGQRLWKKTRLIRDMVALPHHLGHCAVTFCTAISASKTLSHISQAEAGCQPFISSPHGTL